MENPVNTHMCSYVRTLFEHPSKWYESYQENGTRYLKSRRKLDDQLQKQLNACAGEIFLCGIPSDITAEKIAEVASLLGEVYILRFKVHFSGASRGFAYLQYMDPNLMPLALERLPQLFRRLQLPMIKVCISRNSSKLLLRKSGIAPIMVFETLKQLINFDKLVGKELYPDYFEYQIIFKCNEEAVHARRDIMKSILKFGPKAVVIWDVSCRNNEKVKLKMHEEKSQKNIYFANRQSQYVPKSLNTISSNYQQNLQMQNTSNSSIDFLKDFNNLKL